MTRVMVEFPLEEAQGMLKRLAADGTVSMKAAECDAAEAGRQRLERAVGIERGPGGAIAHEEAIASAEPTELNVERAA